MSAFYSADAPMLPLEPESEMPPPPGLLGEVARFIYAAAPRPVPEIAVAASIGFLAGIAGRAFNIYGTGLNQYVLLIADTGIGKEAIKLGVDRLVGALTEPRSGGNPCPYASAFVGPADMASGPALLKAVARRNPPSFVSIIGEFGLRFKQMAHERANAADSSLLRTMLDLYNKSGHGQVVGETVYSDKEKNTAAVHAPAISFIGESTPDTFYGNLNDGMISNGLLPRFTIIEYQGPRPRWNRMSEHIQPEASLLENLAKLVVASYEANIGNRAIRVEMMPDAEACLDELDIFADDQINGSRHNVTRELWNRAHIKAAKLAALIAVGCNSATDFRQTPVITLDMAMWARAQIERDIRRLLQRFESGEVGEAAGDEVRQQNAIVRCIGEYMTKPHDEFPGNYGIKPEMHRDFVFTQNYLSRRVLSMSAFKHDRIGATAALHRALRNLIEADDIRELPKQQAANQYGTTARCFIPSNPARFADTIRMTNGRGA